MLQLREFVQEQHYIFCKQEYDTSRRFLKTCGKPKDWFDIYLIKHHKETCSFFKQYA